ncbi:MAG: LPXTG cell wall anchor domain-containing protein [Actinomycetota bacterium]|nr:LPXTG cell wall anchor domain-containing protein [Actinomycetota bacterium]
MRKLMMLAATMALVALAVAAPAAFGQPTEAKINEDVFSQAEKGKATAKAGGTEAKAEPCPEGAASQSGDITAKAPCPPKMPPPPPVMPPPPAPAPPPPPKMEEKKELPKTGGSSSAALLALGSGALLVGGGLLVRRLGR